VAKYHPNTEIRFLGNARIYEEYNGAKFLHTHFSFSLGKDALTLYTDIG